MKLKYDLHIHSCLSPCGDNDMTPANIAGMAALAGLDLFSVSDHNSARNCRAAAAAAAEYGLLFVPGVELTTDEEAHILCLFPSVDAAERFSEEIYSTLTPTDNRPEFFGDQLIVDQYDNVVDTERRLLIGATGVDTYSAAALVDGYGGIALPAHIDRDSFSVIANLGFFDRRMGYNIVEITRAADRRALAESHSQLRGLPFITNSDAHSLGAIFDGEFELEVSARTTEAVIEALRLGKTGMTVEL